MKTIFKFICVFAAALALNANLPAQSPVAPKNSAQTDLFGDSDEAVDRIISQLNALPLDFKIASAEMLPGSLANLRKHAALLKEMPGAANVVIGVHTFAVGDEAQNKIITQKRADYLKTELIKLGVSASALTASGYGSSKPVASNATEQDRKKNRRVEYTRAEMTFDFDDIFETQMDSADSANDSAQTRIVAGKGWEKVVIGAAQTQIEIALGKPEKFYEGNMLLPNSSAHYFQKGIIINYNSETNLVKEISFIGNPANLDAGSYAGTFQTFAGKPDKNIAWGASASDVSKAYGAAKKTLSETRNGVEEITLIYDQIVFTLRADKLYYIVVSNDNNRLLAVKTAVQPTTATEIKKPTAALDYKADYVIVAGKGFGKIVVGANMSEVEAVLGKPEKLEDDSDFFGTLDYKYFSKGIQITFNSKTKTVTNILLFGNPAGTSFKDYKLFSGKTDKGVGWGASPAEVIKAYGKPTEERFDYASGKPEYEFIRYPNVEMGFRENKLYFISSK